MGPTFSLPMNSNVHARIKNIPFEILHKATNRLVITTWNNQFRKVRHRHHTVTLNTGVTPFELFRTVRCNFLSADTWGNDVRNRMFTCVTSTFSKQLIILVYNLFCTSEAKRHEEITLSVVRPSVCLSVCHALLFLAPRAFYGT